MPSQNKAPIKAVPGDSWYRVHLLISYSSKDTGILIPGQQRILSGFRLRFFHISPSPQELLMRQNPSELACNRPVHQFHDIEIGWE